MRLPGPRLCVFVVGVRAPLSVSFSPLSLSLSLSVHDIAEGGIVRARGCIYICVLCLCVCVCVCVRFQVNYSIIAVDILLFVVRRSCRPADPAPGSLSDFLARKFLRYHARLLALPVVVTRSNFRPRYTRRITRLPFAKLFARLPASFSLLPLFLSRVHAP